MDKKEKIFECHLTPENSIGQFRESVQNFDFSCAKGIAKQISFDGIAIDIGTYKSKEDFSLCGFTDSPMIELHVNFKGTTISSMKDYPEKVVMNQDDCNLFYSELTDGIISSQKDQDYSFISFNIIPEFFENMVHDCGEMFFDFVNLIGRRDYLALAEQNLKLSPEMKNILWQITDCRFQGKLKNVYLKSKIIEFLILFADRIDNRIGKFSFSKGDKDKIHYAREVLLQDCKNPPTLSQLARKTGLNEFKLKKGFKEVFGNTVYGYLLEHKLENARIMLLEEENTISEIAYKTGYSSTSHFSTAFRKKFGFAPSAIR